MFLFTLMAGALADLVEPRRFLIGLESLVVFMMSVFGAVVFFNSVTPTNLIATTFVLSACWSLAAPAWLSITPLLVPARDLDSANAANSVGYDISRAIGPNTGGARVGRTGLGAYRSSAPPIWPGGCAHLVARSASTHHRPPARASGRRRSDGDQTLRRHPGSAIHHDPHGHGAYPFACAYTALLPLVARDQTEMGPNTMASYLRSSASARCSARLS